MGFCESGEANRRQCLWVFALKSKLGVLGFFLIKWPGSVRWPASWLITSGDLAEKTTYWKGLLFKCTCMDFIAEHGQESDCVKATHSWMDENSLGIWFCVPETLWINTLSWVLETRLGIFPYFPCLLPPPSLLKPWLWEKCPSPVLCCDAGRDKYQPWCLHAL